MIKRELLLFFGVAQFPKASNIVFTCAAVDDFERKFVKYFVDTVLPAPDKPVITIHCDLLFFFNEFSALLPKKRAYFIIEHLL